MSAPNLTRALVLETPVASPDGAGGQVITWAALGTLWADIRAGAGRERLTEFGPASDVSLRILVRASPVGAQARPRAGQRLRDGARLFRLIAVTEADAQGRYLTCTAIEETSA
jgi:head-tail adaptor